MNLSGMLLMGEADELASEKSPRATHGAVVLASTTAFFFGFNRSIILSL